MATKPQIPVRLLDNGKELIVDVPADQYGGQLRPARCWIIPDSQRVVFSMIDKDGKIYIANFDRDQLRAAVNAGEILFGT